jgi:acyl carrier protein
VSTTDDKLCQILDEVAADLREVLGPAWAADLDISMETSFVKDLEIESIEMVALAEQLQARYGPSIDLAAWLSDREIESLTELRVRDLVEYIAASVTG